MATGYNENGGVIDLLCAAPPDFADFVPNAYSGIFCHVTTPMLYPSYALNLSDFSFEAWLRWGMGNLNVTSDVYTTFGISDAVTPNFIYSLTGACDLASIYFSNVSYIVNDIRMQAGAGAWETSGVAGGYAIPMEWCHLAVTFDRDGNMLSYINSSLVDTFNMAAGAAQSMGTVYLIGPGAETHGDYTQAANYDGFFWPFEMFSFTQVRTHWGPWAIHNRILTPAEISQSYRERRCQSLGAATTIIYIDPKNVDGVSEWDFDPTHVGFGIRASTLGLNIGIPAGVAETVRLLDSSGNNRHITLPTRTGYADVYGTPLNGVADVRGWVGFTADPFWK